MAIPPNISMDGTLVTALVGMLHDSTLQQSIIVPPPKAIILSMVSVNPSPLQAAHYRSPIDFSKDSLHQSERSLDRIRKYYELLDVEVCDSIPDSDVLLSH